MEDDDEFGDLYTDVLSTFPSSSSSALPTPTASASVSHPSIDLNLQSDGSEFPTTNSLNLKLDIDENQVSVDDKDSNASLNSNSKRVIVDNFEDSNNLGSDTRVLQTADLNLDLKQELPVEDDDAKDASDYNDVDKEHKFGLEDDLGSEPLIPGISNVSDTVAAAAAKPVGGGGGDDWDSDSDSDSEDDLQIVLNDTHHGPMGMEANGGRTVGVGSDDDEDEDGEPLVIVADDDAATAGGLQVAEEHDWGDETGQTGEGKESGVDGANKANAGVSSAPKVGYSNYGYHPFHSQFKYVRPGAAPLPGGPPVGSGGAPGQVRPPVNASTMAGRGRGDWRPPGMKGPPMQKGFHPGFWGSNGPGRGLEFTLPSHKTIFDVDIDSFEEKPWKYPGVDVSDFFNFGLNEESWKEYCKQLEQLRLESTMQSKIRVYESGRAEQEYDPDMPPELAAAAGIHDSSTENVDTAKVDGGTGDPAKGSVRQRPPLPTGRAIQVETGCGERLPSVDTCPNRMRDADAVIEIVLQDSADNESAGNDAGANSDNDSAREDDQVDVVDEDGPQCGDEYFGSYPREGEVMKEDDSRIRTPLTNARSEKDEEEADRSSPERAPSDHHPGSRGHASSENVVSPGEERWTQEKERRRSPHMSSGESTLDRRSIQPKKMEFENHQQLQVFIKSPISQTPNHALTLNSSQTWGDLKKFLTSSSSFLSFNGKILEESTRIESSNITPLSTLNLHVKALGGGGDGGATGAESRDCYLNMYAEKKPDKVDPNEKRLSKWTTCALSFEPLKPPCVIDRLGNVFNKEALVKALLAKSLPKPFSQYIKGLKDLIPIQLQEQQDSNSMSKFQCPISEVEFNGMFKFFALSKCGHVLSAKALKEVKSSACLVCHTEFGEDDKIVINGSEEEVEVLRKRMIAMKEVVREKKVKKSKSRAKEGVEECGDGGLSGKKHGIEGVNGGKSEVDSKLPNGMVGSGDGKNGQEKQQAKRFKAVDVAPANANKEVYASLFTSSAKKSGFKETYSCRSLPLGRN